MKNDLMRDGYCVTNNIFCEAELYEIEFELGLIKSAGERTMLDHEWCMKLALKMQDRLSGRLRGLADLHPVQCTYFQKNQDKNWLVPWHQDRLLPLMETKQPLGVVRTKDGRQYYQASEHELSKSMAIRLSIDESNRMNGGLRVLLGTHKSGLLSEREVLVMETNLGFKVPGVNRGSALVMSPLLLHSSSKSKSSNQRRVLHFTYR